MPLTQAEADRLKAAIDALVAPVQPAIRPLATGLDTSAWTPTFADTFGVIDWSVWDSVLPNSDHALSGSSEFANGEMQWYVNHSGPLPIVPWTVSPNGLTLSADRLPQALVPTIGYDQPGAHNLGSYRYSSGLLHSKPGFSQQYGFFQIRCRLPAGKGLWPGFWMLPMSGKWPPEFDIFEFLMHDPNTGYTTQHAPDGSTGGIRPWVSDSTQWHTYGVLWTPTAWTLFLDGVRNANPIANRISEPMHLVLDLAVGGPASWPGQLGFPVDPTTSFPARMDVSHVAAWRTA